MVRTGMLGDVMKESVEAARSVVRARADQLGLKSDVFSTTDWHIHFPEGAIPKDGPSAGAAITTAMVSTLTGIPVPLGRRHDGVRSPCAAKSSRSAA